MNDRAVRIIAACDEAGDIVFLDDGYMYYYIPGRGGLSAADLRIIADEVDKRNKLWDEQVMRDLHACEIPSNSNGLGNQR